MSQSNLSLLEERAAIAQLLPADQLKPQLPIIPRAELDASL